MDTTPPLFRLRRSVGADSRPCWELEPVQVAGSLADPDFDPDLCHPDPLLPDNRTTQPQSTACAEPAATGVGGDGAETDVQGAPNPAGGLAAAAARHHGYFVSDIDRESSDQSSDQYGRNHPPLATLVPAPQGEAPCSCAMRAVQVCVGTNPRKG